MNATATPGTVAERMREAEATVLAVAIAYYAFVSVLPGLLPAVAVATAVGGRGLRRGRPRGHPGLPRTGR